MSTGEDLYRLRRPAIRFRHPQDGDTSGTPGDVEPVARSKILSRKRHTKSRQGCRGCKARRVKCDERTPSCSNCFSRGLRCHYAPAIPPGAIQAARALLLEEMNLVSRPMEPTSMGSLFSSKEMGFFHHFLIAVSHPLPLGNDAIWIKEIPQLAHQNPFLLHSMVALGASEFRRAHPEVQTNYEMLKHRGLAISGLSSALHDATAWSNPGHSDALLATCYALMYQSATMSDGLQDFNTFVRGSALVTERIRETGLKTSLIVARDWPIQRLQSGLQYIETNAEDLELVEQGIEALDELKRCSMFSDEDVFWQALRRTLCSFIQSPARGFLESMLSYGNWYHLSDAMMQALCRPNNLAALILITTFCANMTVVKIIIPLRALPSTGPAKLPVSALTQMSDWIEAIRESMPQPLRRHLDWQLSVFKKIARGGKIELEASESRLDFKLDVIENLETKAHMLLGDILKAGSEVTAWFEKYCVQWVHNFGIVGTPAPKATDERSEPHQLIETDAKSKSDAPDQPSIVRLAEIRAPSLVPASHPASTTGSSSQRSSDPG